ncbi:MAG TPA: hypothetical protein VIK89_02980, partial [Cytophagaceae bacterium]
RVIMSNLKKPGWVKFYLLKMGQFKSAIDIKPIPGLTSTSSIKSGLTTILPAIYYPSLHLNIALNM